MPRARALVIDDDPTMRQLIAGLLRRDYLVAVANDGMDGYSRALEHTPDVVLLDVLMPNWDGLKTLREFRQHPQLRKVPVIMLTADSKKATVLAAVQAGAADYIIKSDMSPEKLLTKLSKALSKGLIPVSVPVAGPHVSMASSPIVVPVPVLTAAASALPGGISRPTVAPIAEPAVKMIPTSTFDESAVQAILDSWE